MLYLKFVLKLWLIFVLLSDVFNIFFVVMVTENMSFIIYIHNCNQILVTTRIHGH